MVIPNQSNAVSAACIRYCHYLHEKGRRSGPDWFVGMLLPRPERKNIERLSGSELAAFQSHAAYDYLLARTLYYDESLAAAIRSGVRLVVNIGCGTDTRAIRFEPLLRRHSVEVLECDLPEMIRARHRLLRRLNGWDYVRPVAVDLERRRFGTLGALLANQRSSPVLVILEGVSPYIDRRGIAKLLEYLHQHLPGSATLVYDFKRKGIHDRFGAARPSSQPFRLPRDARAIQAFHRSHGWKVTDIEWSEDVIRRYLGRKALGAQTPFAEDGFVCATRIESRPTRNKRPRRGYVKL